jgi:hypothetical protein
VPPLPTISSLSPTSGTAGTFVTVSGSSFGSSQGASTVTLNGLAATVTSWSDTAVVISVPSNATTGNIVVIAGGAASNGATFTVTGALVSTPFAPQKRDAKLTRIVPKQMHAQFSQGDSTKVWTDHLDSPAKKTIYTLSLEPDLDVGKHVIVVDLVLRDADEPRTNENLLSPAKNWHGLEPYNFVASDLLHGADRSVFGARRSIKITGRELDVEIQIVDESLGRCLMERRKSTN